MADISTRHRTSRKVEPSHTTSWAKEAVEEDATYNLLHPRARCRRRNETFSSSLKSQSKRLGDIHTLEARSTAHRLVQRTCVSGHDHGRNENPDDRPLDKSWARACRRRVAEDSAARWVATLNRIQDRRHRSATIVSRARRALHRSSPQRLCTKGPLRRSNGQRKKRKNKKEEEEEVRLRVAPAASRVRCTLFQPLERHQYMDCRGNFQLFA